MKKCLVTGGAGFIGCHLAKKLADEGQHVTVCDNLFRGKADEDFKRLTEMKNVQYIQADLTAPESFKQFDKNYDYVYHLAAINGTKNFYEIPDKVLRVNTLAAVNILDWFITAKCKKILFTSSSETYAGTMRLFGVPIPTPENVPLSIEDIHNPRWSYGGSKIIGELFFANYARVHKFDMSIIRYHNIYGARMGYEHVIPEFIARIEKKEDPFKIFGGTETRAFCYVDDATEATKSVMESSATNGEIVHIGNDTEEITIKDLAKRMFGIAGVSPKLDIQPAPSGSVQRRCPDISKLKKMTGYSPRTSLEDGLKKTFVWYQRDIRNKKR